MGDTLFSTLSKAIDSGLATQERLDEVGHGRSVKLEGSYSCRALSLSGVVTLHSPFRYFDLV